MTPITWADPGQNRETARGLWRWLRRRIETHPYATATRLRLHTPR